MSPPIAISTMKLIDKPMIHNKLFCEQVAKIVSADVLLKLKNLDLKLKSVRSHTELAETANSVRELAKNLSKAQIKLDVKRILIITKARDNSLIYLTREMVEWLFSKRDDITVYVDCKLQNSARFNAEAIMASFPEAASRLKYWDTRFAKHNPELFDLVVTLGGDGTVLLASTLFQRVVPPVVSFALGSLGFLTNFNFEDFKKVMTRVWDEGVKANLRMRFSCRVHRADGTLVSERQVLNELVIDRGPSPYVTNLELYGDDALLTVCQADGLIVATPTGSTAYSLSAGGSLVHPGVSAISITPICPHTLSFRPILLPDTMLLKVKVPETSRATAWCSFDGKVRTEIFKGDYVTIQASPFPFPSIVLGENEYIESVSRNLHWNVRESQKPLGDLLTGKCKSDYTLHDEQALDKFDIDYSEEDTELSESYSEDSSSRSLSSDLLTIEAKGPGGLSRLPTKLNKILYKRDD